ncbi:MULTISPECIES: NADH-quinone oxidoreductase subunit A [Hymenobacter]|uniref:NADH-quinone oxidoreductase subunit A n=2 Tax=Hymenobacter TaxID=89966 RepID=A0ABS6WWS5_9BACT|nr:MULTISPECIES: NADH-quinone oxidoreductase subunit A [Hymenobacter]MBO3271444.1 NADH-quinone oxidoreductase subunit A [Hymenobacter defluvii]MBW3128047.1 NADH-quinone oxidoreductase subunit A [Hymenobacter profundi]QNE38176.1 NADH-quinone oxidoreductase subunit A [Hymenobacter sp. NBH84]
MLLAVNSINYQPVDYLPMLVQFILAIAFVAFAMVVSHLVGPKRHSKVKDASWECGIESVGNARTPISVKYFLTAILFVLFDVEVIFMYPWAVNFRKLGTFGFVEMVVYLALVMAGFGYVIRKGILKWSEIPTAQPNYK